MTDETSPGTWHFYRRAALAPLLLCVIAGLHAYRVWAYDQTQWKGGGFGMFSTVDSRVARFLRIYLLTPDGEVPVAVPDELHKRAVELRAIPTQEGLTALTEALAMYRWYQTDLQWGRIARHLPATGAHGIADRATIHPPDDLEPVALTHRPGEPWPVQGVRGREAQRLRQDELPISGIRAELWRYQFDQATNRIVARRQFEVTREQKDGS